MDVCTSVSGLFETHARLFWDRKFTELSLSAYRHPLPVYAYGRIFVRKRPEDTAEALFQQRQVAVQRGVCGVRPGTVAYSAAAPRFAATVTWLFQGPQQSPAGDLRIRYYVSTAKGGLRIDMAEYLGGSHEIPAEAVPGTPEH